MDGWQSVEDLMEYGFTQAQVVMASEAHDGLTLRSRSSPASGSGSRHKNLCHVLAQALFVWCGNSHAGKQVIGKWVPMGYHFASLSGTAAFVIDQDVTVDFPGVSREWVPDPLSSTGDRLDALGGTAAILREQAPPPLSARAGVDAVVVSTDNALQLNRSVAHQAKPDRAPDRTPP